MVGARKVLIGYVAAGATGCLLFLLLTGVPQQAVYHLETALAAGAIFLGVRLHRPAARRPWILLGGGLAVLGVADVTGDLVRAGMGGTPLSTLAAIGYVICFGLFATAVREMARIRTPEGDQDAVIDALVVAAATALVLWQFLLTPALTESGMTAVEAGVRSAFPLIQVGLCALYLRLLFAGAAHRVSAWLIFVGGGLAGLAGSVAYLLLSTRGVYDYGDPTDLFWVVAYLSVGAAALCPDMAGLAEPGPTRPGGLSRPRLVVLGVALLGTTATAAVAGSSAGRLQLFFAVLPVPLLVLWRLLRLVREREAVAGSLADQVSRLALVADLGRQALAGGEIDRLLDDTVDALRLRLSADVTTLLEVVEDGRRLSVRANSMCAGGTPLDRGLPIEVLPDSQAALALATGQPVSSDDLSVERRFRALRPVVDAGLRASLVVVVGTPSQPFGLLSVHCLRPRRWQPGDIELVQSVGNILATAVERRTQEERTAWVADHDLLTGLPNRSRLLARIRAWSGRQGPVAVLFLDLDGLKATNDRWGHACGDVLLQRCAERLRTAVRGQDFVHRLAGDEFVVLCPDITSSDAARVAERVVTVVGHPVALPSGGVVHSSASVGLATGQAAEATALLRAADDAMYAAKRAGGGAYRTAPPVAGPPRTTAHLGRNAR